MRRNIVSAAVALIAIEALVAGQSKDANQVLAEARAALGGDKIATVKSLSAAGRTLRTNPSGNTTESEFEMAMELPDKYLMRSVMVAMGNMSIYRNTGFNGNQAIDEIDRPPNLQGGNVVIRIAGPGGAPMDPAKMTPEQKAEADRLRLTASRKEFSRLTLGMFAASPAVFPLEFTYAGQAESADGRADVIAVKGQNDFSVSLFVDAQTHLPLMLSWMDKEPIVIQTTAGPGGASVSGDGSRVVKQFSGGNAAGGAAGGAKQGSQANLSPEEREKQEKDVEARRKETEAKRRTVEFRLYYGEYKSVGGVKLPFRIQRSIDGKTTEEMLFDTIKVNPKIDARKFEIAK